MEGCALECVGENQVQRNSFHRKSKSTGQMNYPNHEIAQLVSNLYFNRSSPRDRDVRYMYPDNDKMMYGMEDVEEGEEEDEDTYSESSLQESSTTECSSPDTGVGRLQELAGSGSLGRLRNNALALATQRSTSVTPCIEEGVASPIPSLHQRIGSFDFTQLRLNLSKLEPQVSISSVDTTVDQLLAVSVGYALWASATPTPRKSPSPSPQPDQLNNRPAHRWIQSLPGDSNKDALMTEVNNHISDLKHRQIKLTVEKELLEEEMEYWRTRVSHLEQRVIEAEEAAADKQELVSQMESQLEMWQRQPSYIQTQTLEHDAPTTSQHDNHNMLSMSDMSVSYQSGTSSLLKVGRMSEEDVKELYPPLDNAGFEELLHTKKAIFENNDGQKDLGQQQQQSQQSQQMYNLKNIKNMRFSATNVLRMLWYNGKNSNTDTDNQTELSDTDKSGFSKRIFSTIRQVLQDEKYRSFWDWFLVVIFPLMGYAGLSLFTTLLLAIVSIAWRKGVRTQLGKLFNNNSNKNQSTKNA
eukprot:TRINITY_DN16752_c0_g1_i6.p1 TRINITY_DN16752_c0_g1~~TRINITY_DN16752_c0_g1_i6.p1  ORF type:complete len:590 (-),score=74.77 TRINITY_DN16752_c0_g1_i6:749-2320(-)